MIDPRTPDFANTPVSPQRPEFSYLPETVAIQPKVTIVTPLYNGGPEFLETAQSVLQQSLQEFEWVIVNDGSTSEETLQLLKRVKSSGDTRIRVIHKEKNKGLSAARNTGASLATTDFIVFLDGDDLLEPTAIEYWYWALQSHPEASFVNSRTVGFGEKQYLWDAGFHDGRQFLEENRVCVTSMIRGSVYQGVGGFDETIRGGMEDWDFWLKCATRKSWGFTVPEYLNWYRRRATHTDRWENLDQSANTQKICDTLRLRYPQLWEQDFLAWRLEDSRPFEDIPEQLPSQNILRKSARRLLMILPWLTTGGADKFNFDLIRQLKKKGYEVSIATTMQSDNPWLGTFAAETPDVFNLPSFLQLKDYPRFLEYLVRSRQIDEIFLSNSDLGYLLLPYLRWRFPDLPIVDFCHMEEESWNNGGYPRRAVQFQHLLDSHIVSSEHLKRWLGNRGVTENKIHVCYTNIDPVYWTRHVQTRSNLRQQLGVGEADPVILFAGRLVDQKQPLVLAESIRLLHQCVRNFKLLVVGDGPHLRYLDEFTKKHGLTQNVLLLGDRPNTVVKDLLNAADIFFLPSQWEGIALSIYEAMAMGLAVVGAKVGGQAELVTSDCGYLIDRSTSDEEARRYAAVLASLAGEPDQIRAMGTRARERIVRLFSLDTLGETICRLLAESHVAQEKRKIASADRASAMSATLEALEVRRLQDHSNQMYAALKQHKERDPVSVLQRVDLHLKNGKTERAYETLCSISENMLDMWDEKYRTLVKTYITQLEGVLKISRPGRNTTQGTVRPR